MALNFYTNKVIWLTGASSGIGRALAIELCQLGAILALTSRNISALEDLHKNELLNSPKVYIYPADVCDQNQINNIAEQIIHKHGKIDILIANAGTHVFTDPLNFDCNEYIQLMEVNYGGMLHCIEPAVKQMLKQGYGHIVGMASLAGFRGLPRAAAYGASKSAMIHFLESIRFHLQEHNIQVTIVNPGFIKTPLTDKNDFGMPFLTSAEVAAKKTCLGIAKHKKEIVFPIIFAYFLKFLRVIPFWIYEILIKRQWQSMRKNIK